MSVSETDVLAFLRAHPDWLQDYATEFKLRPIESKIMSFQQGSMLALKRKTQKMAAQLVQILNDADANQALVVKIMNFNQRLLAVNNLNQWSEAIVQGLKIDFSLPHHALRVLIEPPKNMSMPLNLIAKPDVKAAGSKLIKPLCGVLPVAALIQLLPDHPHLESFLQLPLRWRQQTIGLLLIGHENVTHFQSDQSTKLISIMADGIAIVLARLLKLAD